MSRLEGMRKLLLAGYEANASMSSSSKGREREEIANSFLSNILPLPYRFGTGDITDISGRRSGQVDIVVEYPFLPSIPSSNGDVRLYLVESVAAVIEVKSDISGQWNEAKHTSDQVKTLTRQLGSYSRNIHGGTLEMSGRSVSISGMTLDGRNAPPGVQAAIEMTPEGLKIMGRDVSSISSVPVFVVSYKGWKTPDSYQKYLKECNVDGILVLDSGGIFISGDRFSGMMESGPAALWGFICCLHEATKELSKISTNPVLYASSSQ